MTKQPVLYVGKMLEPTLPRLFRTQANRTHHRPGDMDLVFWSLKGKLCKNLQSIMARSMENKCSKNRESDHFTFASLFRLRNLNYQYNNPVDMKNIEEVVQPSIIVPHEADDQPFFWDSSSASDCSNEWIGFRQDADGSDIGEGSFSNEQHGLFLDQIMARWMDSPE